MKIIDSHAHIYERICGFGGRGELRPIGDGRAKWANGEEEILIPEGLGDKGFSAEQLLKLMDENNIERTLILQGSLYGFQNEYIYESVCKYSDRFAGACTVDPFASGATGILKYLISRKAFSVVKFEVSTNCGLMSYHKPFALDGIDMDAMYQIISEKGATLVLDIGRYGTKSYQPDAVACVAKKYPKMKIVICHLMSPTLGERDVLSESLKKLNVENVWFDLAAVPWNTKPAQYPYATGIDYIALAKEIVGHKKLIWGSDAPSVMISDSYKQLCDYLMKADVFTENELMDIYYNNACDVYPFQR
ncbi:MAG: amidohydrolase family protein [Flexilinea sp.]